MQSFKPILFQNLRRAAMIMGLAMFVMFAHKASSEVSSPNIAAGNQRQQTLVAVGNGRDSISRDLLASEKAVATVNAPQEVRVPAPLSFQDHSESLSETKSGQPPRRGQGKTVDAHISVKVNDKRKPY